MDAKFVKYKDDECFGQSFELVSQCTCCWVKDACWICFKNREK